MNERIKDLAEQAFMVCLKGADEKHLEQLERFAELVRQEEREINQELVEALEEMVRQFDQFNLIDCEERAIEEARAALAKAKGETE